MYCIAFTNYSKNKIFQTRYSYYKFTVLTKREELSFLRVLAFPKATTKRKAFWELKQQEQNQDQGKGI